MTKSAMALLALIVAAGLAACDQKQQSSENREPSGQEQTAPSRQDVPPAQAPQRQETMPQTPQEQGQQQTPSGGSETR